MAFAQVDIYTSGRVKKNVITHISLIITYAN